MSTIKKTIQINPELFSLGSNKTRKNRENKDKSLKPFISPNILKNKLLKRIKEHKRKENESLGSKVEEKVNSNSLHEEKKNYTDEFNDSIEYSNGKALQAAITSTLSEYKELKKYM